ncbi:MAG: hypothetical protein AAF928_02310 [Myxococcota bacterium]
MWVFAFVAGAAPACQPGYAPTVRPQDASFELACGRGCGDDGSYDSVAVDVVFGGQTQRRFAVCCEHRPQILARLQVIDDMYCAGLDVPPRRYGNTVVGTTVSPLTRERAATLDQGDGYVTFACGGWLPQLIEALRDTSCCRPERTAPLIEDPTPGENT